MMYQRDIDYLFFKLECRARQFTGLACARHLSRRAEEAEQELDDGAERRIGGEEEEGEHAGHDQHHDRRAGRFLTVRPHHLGDAFAFDLADELAD